jgi:hypothetical protein
VKTLKVVEPPKRSAGVKVPNVKTLVEKLKGVKLKVCWFQRAIAKNRQCVTRCFVKRQATRTTRM